MDITKKKITSVINDLETLKPFVYRSKSEKQYGLWKTLPQCFKKFIPILRQPVSGSLGIHTELKAVTFHRAWPTVLMAAAYIHLGHHDKESELEAVSGTH